MSATARCMTDAMTPLLVLEQLLNGVQFGVMLFLMAAGLTLVFGIMNLVNFAHGVDLHDRRLSVRLRRLHATGSFVLAVAGRAGRRAGHRRRWSR